MTLRQRSHRSRVVLAGIMAMVLLGSSSGLGSWFGSTVSAADPSDIPGVPLPGPVAAGRLGGAIYDVVYSLTVQPGYVIVASVSGTPGTDFDLYLFDSSATTVLSPTGLLTKSTGPTSDESISWPTRLGGIFYIDLNGATNVEGDYRLTVQALPDATPPSLSVSLAGGRPATNQHEVAVTLKAVDDLSGVTEMALSSDGVTFEAWRPFQASTTWSLPAGDGVRRVWAKVMNGVGLESPVAQASVVVDTVPPVVTAIEPLPGSSVAGLRPTMRVTFGEAVDPPSWNDLGLIVQAATGALVPGAYAYDVVSRTGSFTPSTDLQAGKLYIVTVGAVDDVAGNRVVFPGSWSITPLTPTSLTAVANPKVILQGGSARIDLALSGGPLPATLGVSIAAGSSDFVPAAPIPTTDGTNVFEVAPQSNTTYRFDFAGTDSVAAAHTSVRVLVRRSVALAGLDSSVRVAGHIGGTVRLTATVRPATAGVPVSFRLYRYDTVRRAWRYAGSHGRSTDAAGRASYAWVPASAGMYYWRVVVGPTVEYANNVSPVYRWSIGR